MIRTLSHKKDWFVVLVPSNPDVEEAISNFLFESGAQGLVQQESAVEAYFTATVNPEKLKVSLQRYLVELSALSTEINPHGISISQVQNRDWNAEWKKHLKPIVISQTFAIRPSWIKTSAHLAEHVIEIDPQMAFGTGSHATTRLILRLMENYCCQGCKVLDVGTGTGVLAIAAAVIFALDLDPIAVATAKNNCRKNRVADRIHLFVGTIDALRPIGFDVILANLNHMQILPILPALIALANKSTIILLSGILTREENLICSELSRSGLAISEAQYENEWVALVTEFS